MTCRFPPYFAWGVSTAAPQIEGSADADGRGPSIWDVFAKRPGAIAQGDTPAVACDHYRRWEADLDLMRDLGIRNYRFSLSWSRILPDGSGRINQAGLDFYRRLTDGMRARGIEPWCTLYHWDLPQALQDAYGGWLDRRIVADYAAYVEIAVRALVGNVRRWMTVNEMQCFIGVGYKDGTFAPGLKVGPQVKHQAYHHALLAHGAGVAAVRAYGGRDAQVGLAYPLHAHVPVTPSAADRQAAMDLFERSDGRLLGPLAGRGYPAAFLDHADAPRMEAGDEQAIGQPIDFMGVNNYGGGYARMGADGPETVALPPGYPSTDMSGMVLNPEGLTWAIRSCRERFGFQRYIITENGAACQDIVGADGSIVDLDRRLVISLNLREIQRLLAEGITVDGYFCWSFLDNFEWASGYAKRFGLVHVDYATQRRTPKLSARWYAGVIAAHGLDGSP
ncbi:MAG: hypothetical protein RLZZ127_2873 [Planctomycetota bacterium]|jgi:beta-glucosidase